MCDPSDRRTVMEKVLDEQKQTNQLLRQLAALLSNPLVLTEPSPPKRERIKEIQRILGVPADGIIGPQTRRAFNYLEQ